MSQVANFSRHDALLDKLHEMRDFGGPAITRGLTDEVVLDFLRERDDLALAIDRAYEAFVGYKKTHADFLALEEGEQIRQAHTGLTNFYAKDAVNPYVAVGAAGPWIITLKGAVVYDVGGYGMLGFGHAPQAVLDAMNQTHGMANICARSIWCVAAISRSRSSARISLIPMASGSVANPTLIARSAFGLSAPLVDFPCDDEQRDTARMNDALETLVGVCPTQYMWGLRLFRTRPDGEPSLYRRRSGA